MKEWFLARDYPENIVNEQINKVVFGKSQPSWKNSQNGIPFVVTYHPKVKKLGKLIKIYVRFCIVMKKFKRCSHLLQWSHIEALEK